ncbi:paraneoplastic antigen Ma1 homolog [Megalobrama amblycephala]|uniref:paraneoplastic antigen Ma1 homolog n=1 Tax=Megalobrama amblycephala TaxID=75352 RepID=UPI0020144B61|nr:paraneoplastic antigen Ma1 homolog [Megalobrama amblycephala]
MTVTQPAPINEVASANDLFNPPDVQKIIVEHVIKSDNSISTNQGTKRLRPFSGKLPKPPNEVDFQTWSLHVELMIQDKIPVDMQRRTILESLLPPASDLIRQLGPHADPCDYVKLIDSAYGLVEDGDEIFARFLGTHQNTGEKASEYLQRLQVLITTATKRGGIDKADANKQLLRQFRRGCWDQSLILALQLGLKTETPPDFSEFLLQVRTEEDRRAAKHDRMQRHLGTTKPKSFLNMQLVNEAPCSQDASANVLQTIITETEALRKQVAELKMQLTKKKEQRRQRHANKTQNPAQEIPSARVAEVQAQQTAPKPRPKSWFCFKCGNDGHLARQCENPPNKPLVDQKYEELKEKQDEWQTKYGHLNWNGSRWRD